MKLVARLFKWGSKGKLSDQALEVGSLEGFKIVEPKKSHLQELIEKIKEPIQQKPNSEQPSISLLEMPEYQENVNKLVQCFADTVCIFIQYLQDKEKKDLKDYMSEVKYDWSEMFKAFGNREYPTEFLIGPFVNIIKQLYIKNVNISKALEVCPIDAKCGMSIQDFSCRLVAELYNYILNHLRQEFVDEGPMQSFDPEYALGWLHNKIGILGMGGFKIISPEIEGFEVFSLFQLPFLSWDSKSRKETMGSVKLMKSLNFNESSGSQYKMSNLNWDETPRETLSLCMKQWEYTDDPFSQKTFAKLAAETAKDFSDL